MDPHLSPWSRVRSGELTVHWQQYNPATGWVLDDAPNPGLLQPGPLADPFESPEADGASVAADLGHGGRLVFSDGDNPYKGTWSAYARARQVGRCPEPAHFQVLGPHEVAKLTLDMREDEVFHVVCLENRSRLTLTVDSAKVTGGRSFIGKMKQYRAQKFLLSLQRRVIDLKVTDSGLETENELVAPGSLVYWLENTTARPVALQLWKTDLPAAVPVEALSVAGELFLPGFRQWWADQKFPAGWSHRLSGMTFLTADFSACGKLFAESDEVETYAKLRSAWERVATSVEARSGRAVARGNLETTYGFLSVGDALGSALELRHAFSGTDSPQPAIFLAEGTVLLTDLDNAPTVFGYPQLLDRLSQRHAARGEVWLSLGVHSSPGVAERLRRENLITATEMLAVNGRDHKVLAYRLLAADA